MRKDASHGYPSETWESISYDCDAIVYFKLCLIVLGKAPSPLIADLCSIYVHAKAPISMKTWQVLTSTISRDKNFTSAPQDKGLATRMLRYETPWQ